MVSFINAHIIVGNGQEIDNGTVTVDGTRIVAVDEGRPGSTAGAVVDLEGRTLMPGLIDAHTHMVGGDSAIGHGDEASTFRMGEPLVRAVLNSVDAAQVTLNAGITTVREVLARDFIDVFMREAQAAGQIQAPRMRVVGTGIAMTGGHGEFMDPQGTVDSVAEMIKRVRHLVHHRVDWIKVVSADGPETLGRWWTAQSSPEEIAAGFAEARRLGRRTMAHAMGGEAIINVANAGGDTVEHGWYLSEESCEVMIAKGTYLCPTLGNVVDIIEKGPALQMPWAQMMADDEAAIFDRHAMAIAKGVKIVMGSDCGGNEAKVHGTNADELVLYVRCGMSEHDAIISGTLEAARVLGMDGEIGSVEVGKAADLVILDADPLSDIGAVVSSVVGVVQDGKVIRDDLGMMGELRTTIANRPRLRSGTEALPFMASGARTTGEPAVA